MDNTGKAYEMAHNDFPRGAFIRFALLCTLLYGLAVSIPDAFLAPLNRVTASLSALCIELFGRHAELSGDVISLDGFRVRIVTECTPLYVLVLYGAFVLSVPASWPSRLAGFLSGAASLASVNVLRIAAVTVVGARSPVMFEILHVYLGQVIMILMVIALCLSWLDRTDDKTADLHFVTRSAVLATLLFLPWLVVNRAYVAVLDGGVAFIFSLLHYAVVTPRPLAIYNHTFAVPLYVSIVMAGRHIPMPRRLRWIAGGVLILAGWHTLFRVSHVIWTAFGVNAIEPFHQAIYLVGQFLLPFLLWLPAAGRLGFRHGKGWEKPGLKPAGPLACMLLVLALAWPAEARGQAIITIQQGGPGAFHLRADGLNGMTGGEFRIGYQTESQETPRIMGIGLGAAGAIQADTGAPGSITIRMTTLRPLRGSGLLASIQLSGWITYLSASLRNEKGGGEVPQTRVVNPPEGVKPRQRPERPVPKGREEIESSSEPVPEPVQESSSEQARQSVPVRPVISSRTVALASREPSPSREAGKVTSQVQFRRLESPLERFRTYAGERTPVALAGLFEPAGNGEFRQEPGILLADGVAVARVTYSQTGTIDRVRSFYITGGHCSSTWLSDSGEWVLEVVPAAGALAASVTVLTAEEIVEYPLTVAPPLDLYKRSKRTDEDDAIAEFVRIANGRAAEEARSRN